MKIIVIGASLGGMEALKTVFASLPPEMDAAVFVVWHIAPESPNLLPSILNRVAALPVAAAQDGEKIEAGRAYIAPPDHHLVVQGGRTPNRNGGVVRLTRGPRENRFRPSIDVLFRSAAVAFGQRVIGTILTGALDDGASGLYAVKQRGGLAIVQDPLDAECPAMPIAAMRATAVDHVAPIAVMGNLLWHLTADAGAVQEETVVPENMKTEIRIALEDGGLENGVLKLGAPSSYTCPECHGALMQIEEGARVRFRCHTGHAFSLDTLLVETTKSSEEALWNALRTLQEIELVLTREAERLEQNGEVEAANRCREKMRDIRQRSEVVRRVVLESEVVSEETLIEETPSQDSSSQDSSSPETPSPETP